MSEEHDFLFYETFGDGSETAACSCGWTAEVDDYEAAVDRWENHCDVVFMEATWDG